MSSGASCVYVMVGSAPAPREWGGEERNYIHIHTLTEKKPTCHYSSDGNHVRGSRAYNVNSSNHYCVSFVWGKVDISSRLCGHHNLWWFSYQYFSDGECVASDLSIVVSRGIPGDPGYHQTESFVSDVNVSLCVCTCGCE